MVNLKLTACLDTETCTPEFVIFEDKHVPNVACDTSVIAGTLLSYFP